MGNERVRKKQDRTEVGAKHPFGQMIFFPAPRAGENSAQKEQRNRSGQSGGVFPADVIRKVPELKVTDLGGYVGIDGTRGVAGLEHRLEPRDEARVNKESGRINRQSQNQARYSDDPSGPRVSGVILDQAFARQGGQDDHAQAAQGRDTRVKNSDER